MAQYADKIAAQWLADQPTNKSHRLYPARFRINRDYRANVQTNDPESPRALYSYGPHYPVVIAADDGNGYWINETPYYINDQDRINCDFCGGISGVMAGYHQPRRKATPSSTTKGHRESVQRALTVAGFIPTETTRTIELETTEGEPATHTLRLWQQSAEVSR